MSVELQLPDEWLWRRYARAYDALNNVVGYREMVCAVVDAAGPVEGLFVVEVGCGTGNLLLELLSQRPGRLLGIDASAAMLATAGPKLGARAELVKADGVAGMAQLPSGSVDVVVMSNVLYALPDRAAFWAGAARILAPAGRVVVSNPDRAGFLPAVTQQWRERGARGFADVRLFEVIALNLVIDLIASSGKYAFLSWSELASEAAEAGLPRARFLGRCYGGPTSGMNVVGVFTGV